MIKLGTNTINKMILGDTEIKKAYLGGLIVYEKSSPVPELLTDIVISDTFFVGESLAVTDVGTWSNAPILEYQYRWVVDGLQTSDTGSSRLNVIADDGLIAYCQVRARNAGGWSEWEGSNQYIILATALWLDASDTSTIVSSGGSVSQWNDKSGNNRHWTQPTGSQQPITGTRQLNGRNVLDFDGINDNLIAPSSTYSFFSSSNTIFIVNALDAGTGFSFLLGGGGTGTLNMRYQSGEAGGTRYVHGSADIMGNVVAGITPHINGWSRSGTTLTGFTDGITNTSSNASSVTLNAFRMCSNSTGGSIMNGVVGEHLVCLRDLSNSEKNQVGIRLQNKWGTPVWTNI